MSNDSNIFEKHYENYIRQISEMDVTNLNDILGIEYDGDQMIVPFFDGKYSVSKNGIIDDSGNRPNYMVCVILAKYVLLAPDHAHDDPAWVSFKDFRQTSHFLNVNYFKNDTERALAKTFSKRKNALITACENLGGHNQDGQFQYDASMIIKALPRISLPLLFNDKDDEFSAQCNMLFQKHSEFYLDPESLAMTGIYLAKRLQRVKM